MRVKQMMKQALGCLLLLVLSAVPFLTAPAMADYIVRDQPSQILSNPDPKVSDIFSGSAIFDYDVIGSVATDGDRIVIGARYKDVYQYPDAGAAYLYEKGNKNVISLFNPSPNTGDHFGASVAIDGDYVLIGAPLKLVAGIGGDAGEAYLFKASTKELLQTFSVPKPTGDDRFGWSVAIDGDYVLIGAPLKLVAGIGGDAGEAYLFKASTGELLQTFSVPSPTGDDHFGSSVAIDGDYVLIGAPLKLVAGSGGDSGQAYLFKASTGELVQTFSVPKPTGDDHFGATVALDGDSVVIAARYKDIDGNADAGEAYLFKASTGELVQTFSNAYPTVGDRFGWSVDIDGNSVLIGEILRDVYGRGDAGKAYLFDGSTGKLRDVFLPPSVKVADYFGFDLAIDGDAVVIGAALKDVDRVGDAGEAYLYSVTGIGGLPAQACDAPYVLNPANNHCYSLTAPMSWVEAQQQAETAGGNLVTINDQAEQDWLIDTFGDQIISDMPPSFWIGLTNKDYGDISGKGTSELVKSYKWVSGESSEFSSWNTLWSEPNNDQNSDERYADLCAKEGLVCPQVGVWNDRRQDWPILKGIVERS